MTEPHFRRSERKGKPVSRLGYVAYMATEEYMDDSSSMKEAIANSQDQIAKTG